MLLANLYDVLYFSDDGAGGYTTQFGAHEELEHDAANKRFRLKAPDGTVTEFNDLSHAQRPGLFKSLTSPGGIRTEVVDYTGGEIVEVRRSYDDGSDTVTESFLYDFIAGGANANQLERVTVRRRRNQGAWNNVQKVEYTYFGSSDLHGSLNDLRTVARYEWDGAAWAQLDVRSYRYWKDGDAKGDAHLIKFVVGPEAHQRIIDDGGNPLTSPDSLIGQYADTYFEYDADRRVVKEVSQGGRRTWSFAYTENPNADGSQNATSGRDYNAWFRKTTVDRPDGAREILYTNAYGYTMLRILESGSDVWRTFTRYSDDARVVLKAEPSAVSGHDENYLDLMGEQSDGSFFHLRNDDGLIHRKNYHTTTGNGAAVGRLESKTVQNGQLGDEIKLRRYEYAEHTADGVTVHPVSKEVVYPDADDQNVTIETTSAYTFHSGTTQVERRTTTLPVVSTAQNGSGTAATTDDVYDLFGNLVWQRDERGFITRMVYDIETGSQTRRIDNVDTTQTTDEPAGWSTPTGGGLHLVTDYSHDDQGRVVETLGPLHTIDVEGVATTVRSAEWTVYDEPAGRTLSATGWYEPVADESTLINPVAITVVDKNGNALEEIAAVRDDVIGPLSPDDEFDQSDYVSWTTHQYTDCCVLASTRVYHMIPATGDGQPGMHYDETVYGYDLLDRRNRVVTPGGTITQMVFNSRGLPESTWVGTDDTGATDSDPTGSADGSQSFESANNMVLVTENEYDAGADEGDGLLTKATQHVSDSESRVTRFEYDWRNRRVVVDGELDLYEKRTLDNLGRAARVERFDTDENGNLVSRSDTLYDDLGRVYRTKTYAVDVSTGTVGNALTEETWYDVAGNVAKSLPAGSKLFTKTRYDGLGRPTVQYTGFDVDESTWAEAQHVAGDVILEQTETDFDEASNAVEIRLRMRNHNAPVSQTGDLTDPANNPKARVTYQAAWHDAAGREIASADYGTNGGSALVRPDTVPARSDDVLVVTSEYDAAGRLDLVTDPAGIATLTVYDEAGRRIRLVEDYVEDPPGSSSSSSSESSASSASSSSESSGGDCEPSTDENRTTVWTYTPDGQVATLTAWNDHTGDQTTTYIYGTTLEDSQVATSVLLRETVYPDGQSAGGSSDGSSSSSESSSEPADSIQFTYNRQAERTSRTDQRGCVREFDYDRLGRPTEDRVTTLSDDVDGAVRRLSSTYTVRGQAETLTSRDDATVASGNVVNQVQLSYNDFGQIVTSWQAHDGAVNTSTTPKVQYAYADGSNNTIRPTSMTYPNGRVLTYDYGTTNSSDDAASRVASLIDDDGTTHLVDYEYLGLGSIVEVDYTEPDMRYRLFDPQATGDIYTGLDRHGRVIDCRWHNYGTSTDAVRLKYGYDRASNRIWREDVVAASYGKDFDELYTYDGLHRLKDMQRGALNAQKTAVSSLQFAQCWSLDETGNWQNFREDEDGNGAWTLNQARTANEVNEITDVTESTGPSWATPTYDKAGNMTTVPKPKDPTQSFTATYDAWNRLIKFEDAATSDTIQENEYDARRHRTIRKDYEGGTVDETRHFHYTESWQSIEERLDTSSNPESQHVWGLRYIDALICRDRDTPANGSLDERLYALQDCNWNVVAIVDALGVLKERYAYMSYGTHLIFGPNFESRSQTFADWTILFTSYLLDDRVTL